MDYKKAILELKDSALNDKIIEKDLLTGIDILLEVLADKAHIKADIDKWSVYIAIHALLENLQKRCGKEL